MGKRRLGLVWWQWVVVAVWWLLTVTRVGSTTSSGSIASAFGSLIGAYIVVRLLSMFSQRRRKSADTSPSN